MTPLATSSGNRLNATAGALVGLPGVAIEEAGKRRADVGRGCALVFREPDHVFVEPFDLALLVDNGHGRDDVADHGFVAGQAFLEGGFVGCKRLAQGGGFQQGMVKQAAGEGVGGHGGEGLGHLGKGRVHGAS